MVKPLIDADLLKFEVGFGSEVTDEEGIHNIFSYEFAQELLEQRIHEIMEATESTEDPAFYMTVDAKLAEKLSKERGEEIEYRPNFRESIARTREYKGNRTGRRPYHYHNLVHCIISQYDVKLANGIEADDLMSIDHRIDPDNTIICSRDKDLRITPGWHYGWTCGKNLSFGPRQISELGFLDRPQGSKFLGGGLKFFYSQMLTGDTVDNIPGIPRWGPKKAYDLLHECESEEGLHEKVSQIYFDYYMDNFEGGTEEDNWRTYFKEQASLLWMVRELDNNGEPVFFKPLDER